MEFNLISTTSQEVRHQTFNLGLLGAVPRWCTKKKKERRNLMEEPMSMILQGDIVNDKVWNMSTMALMMAMGGSNKINPLMFLLLNKNEGSTDNLLPLMLLSGGFAENKSE